MNPVVLFAANRSIYKTLGLNCYDAKRDARTYHGPAPVIAHPPCQLWCKMANLNFSLHPAEKNRPGNDGGLFLFAMYAVERWGGVLEHPAYTKAWPHYGLRRPSRHGGWSRSGPGWVCEVAQSAYGHRAEKKTWLYCCGTTKPLPPRWDTPKGTHCVHRGSGKICLDKIPLTKKEANATPLEFAQYLIALAGSCSGGVRIPEMEERDLFD